MLVFVPGYQPLVGLDHHCVNSCYFMFTPLMPMDASELCLHYTLHLEGAVCIMELNGSVHVLNSVVVSIKVSDEACCWTCLLEPGSVMCRLMTYVRAVTTVVLVL